jgi:hypothetical protein
MMLSPSQFQFKSRKRPEMAWFRRITISIEVLKMKPAVCTRCGQKTRWPGAR